jgi:glycosyltransferase involved in cell wall biosynthesis
VRIAVFDYETVPTNPYGKGVLLVVEALCDRHDITVYSARFANPRPDRIRYRRVPAVLRPLVALLVTFRAAAWSRRLAAKALGRRYDVVSAGEAMIGGADVVYSQFCHRAYLRDHWAMSRPAGLRRVARFAYEWLAARLEAADATSARVIVVPSEGLARELEAEYPAMVGKVTVIPNPVAAAADRTRTGMHGADTEREPGTEPGREPAEADALVRATVRSDLGIGSGDVVAAFAALGHFERKGLPLVIEALGRLDDPHLHLLVIGGKTDLVHRYQRIAAAAGQARRIHFAGVQTDLGPWFAASDLFVFPSAYETFSYVTFEAAAAGLPLVVSRLYGVEDAFCDGQHGVVVERTAASVAEGLAKLVAAGADGRREMGARAREVAGRYTTAAYVEAWAEVYERLGTGAAQPDRAAPR